MVIFKRTIPLALAIGFGLLAILGLLFLPEFSDFLTGSAAFLAAVALVLGVFNLLGVHLKRLFSGNGYSGVLVLGMLAVFAVAITDRLEITEGWLDGIFNQVQAPLEAALASLLAFFLLFAGFRLLRRQRSWWSALFVVTAMLVILGSTPLPSGLGAFFGQINALITAVFVNAGMRGILIGVALGTITVMLRFLVGKERPYSK